MLKSADLRILRVENSLVHTTHATKDDPSALEAACLSHVLAEGGALLPADTEELRRKVTQLSSLAL